MTQATSSQAAIFLIANKRRRSARRRCGHLPQPRVQLVNRRVGGCCQGAHAAGGVQAGRGALHRHIALGQQALARGRDLDQRGVQPHQPGAGVGRAENVAEFFRREPRILALDRCGTKDYTLLRYKTWSYGLICYI